MVEKRYGTLRFISSVFRLAGVITLILGLLGALTGAVGAVVLGSSLMANLCWYPACTQIGEPAGSLLIVLAGFLLALALFLAFFGTGELLLLLISIEENTRRTAFVLRMSLGTPSTTMPQPQAQAQPEPNGGAGS